MSARDYESAIEREIEEWPGVAVRFEMGGKHQKAIFNFNGLEQFYVFPASPSDSVRGIHNMLAGMRRVLVEMGAVRNERVKSTRPKSERNPGADLRELPSGEPAPVMPNAFDALEGLKSPIITQAGAYPDIPAELYHGSPNLLPGPSLSSTGAKTLLSKSARHFWHSSAMNPQRVEAEKPHFSVGKAAHDMVLLPNRWEDHYFILPEGFKANATKQFASVIEDMEAARAAGMVVLTFKELLVVEAVVAAIKGNKLAMDTLTNGVTEETLCWQDPVTGVWLRARPDFRPNSILTNAKVRIASDLKFLAPSYATERGFSKAVDEFGFHQSAAWYADGMKAIYGRVPTHWLHIVVEKEAPWCCSLYELPGEDIERGRILNRRAINMFAECLAKDKWPGPADTPKPVGLPHWARSRIDNLSLEETAYAAAA